MSFFYSPAARFFLVFLLFFAISSIFVFTNNVIFDYDSLYHFGHALIYRENGITFSYFPWVNFSSINSLKSDIWYGFHLLLIPFTFFSNSLFAIRLSAVLFSSLFFLSFFFFLHSFKIKFPLFSTLLLLFSSGDFIFRINMSRPHTLSLSLSLFFLLFLLKKSPWLVFLSSFFLSFIHASLFWVPFLILGFVLFFDFIERKKIAWPEFFSLFFGSLLGLLLRPHPFGGLKLVYIQLVDLVLAKNAGVPLKFGRELLPLSLTDISFQFLPLFSLFIFFILFFFWSFRQGYFSKINSDEKIAVFSLSSLSLIFFLLSFLVARRSLDFFSVFAVLFIALIFSLTFEKINFPSKKIILFSVFLIFFLVSAGRSLYVFSLFINNSEPADKFKEVSLWLKDNSKTGEIVFHSYWDNFPNLFFWNRKNYYISGMDPIFSYSFSESLFWENYFIAYRGESFTCGYIRCTEEMIKDVHSALKNDFHASYLVLEYRRSPNFIKNVEKISGFEKVFATDKEVVYKIN